MPLTKSAFIQNRDTELVFPDGNATAAYIYPVSDNGYSAEFYDTYVND